jgi:rhodanese-related sulfurtransferase
VRSEAEYQAGHIPGATLIPINQLPARVGELAGHEKEEVVVHCKGGKRAAAAERVLREAGFTRVVDLEGHMDGWQAAGLPVE